MALVFDNATQSTSASSGFTFSLSNSSLANRVLIVHVLMPGTVDDLTGVTYGGVAMTRVLVALDNSPSIPVTVYSYRLVAPATGVNNVAVTWNNSHTVSASAISFTGADQATGIDAFSSNAEDGTNTQRLSSVTTTIANTIVVCTVSCRESTDTQTLTVSGGTTTINEVFTGAIGNIASCRLAQAVPGFVAIGFTWTDARRSCQVSTGVMEFQQTLSISVTDTFSLTESINVALTHNVVVNDQFTITENISGIISDIVINITDIFTLSELVNISLTFNIRSNK